MHFKHLSWPCTVVKFRVLQSCQFNIAILSSLWGDRWLKTHLDFPLRGNYSFLDRLSLLRVSQTTRNLPGTSPWECLFLPYLLSSTPGSEFSSLRIHSPVAQISMLEFLGSYSFGFYGKQLKKNGMGLRSTLFWSKKKKKAISSYLHLPTVVTGHT